MAGNDILIKATCESTHLKRYVDDDIDADPLWTSRYNATNPDVVIKTHLEFLEAGATAIKTNTYQSSVEGYMEHLGLSRAESIEMLKKSAKLAIIAREKFLKRKGLNPATAKDVPLVMASVGPYGAHLHDGSDYTGNYADNINVEFLKKWHQVRIDAYLEAGVDGLGIETIPCQLEATALADLLCEIYPNVKFWFALQCRDEMHLAHGELFSNVVLSLWNKFKAAKIAQNCLAIGVNCLQPKLVTSLFESINGNRSVDDRIPLVVFANSGEVFGKDGWKDDGTDDDKSQSLEVLIPKWIQLGVKVIGGCCRTPISYIEKYRNIVASSKK